MSAAHNGVVRKKLSEDEAASIISQSLDTRDPRLDLEAVGQ